MLKFLLLPLLIFMLPVLASARAYLIVVDERVFSTPNLANNYEGAPLPAVKNLQLVYGATVDVAGVDINEVPGGINRYLRKGYDLIIAVGPQVCEVAYNAAQNYSYQNFVLIDTHRDSTLPANALGYKFEGAQAAYLAGFVAAKVSVRGQIAFIGGFRNTATINMAKGFQEGARLADPAVNVRISYLNENFKPRVGYNRAKELFNGHTDVILHATEFCGLGFLQAARHSGRDKWTIGINTDDYEGLERDNILVSVKLDYSRAIMEACAMIENDSFKGGRQIKMNLENEGAGLGGYSNAASGIMREAENVKKELTNGSIVLRDRNNKVIK